MAVMNLMFQHSVDSSKSFFSNPKREDVVKLEGPVHFDDRQIFRQRGEYRSTLAPPRFRNLHIAKCWMI